MKQNFKKLGLLITMLTAILFVTGCPNPSSTGGGEKKAKTYTVNILVYDGTNITPLSFKVEEGDTLNSISGFEDPKVNGYTFKGYFTATGEEFKKDTAIKSDLSLTTKFEKIPVVSTSDDGKTTTTEKETKNTDKTTVSTTETVTEHDDDSTTTTVVIIVKNDETDKKISEDTTSTTTDKDGNVTASSSETIQYDEEEKITSYFDKNSINYVCLSKFIPSKKRQTENYNLTKELYKKELNKYNNILSAEQIKELHKEQFVFNNFDIKILKFF